MRLCPTPDPLYGYRTAFGQHRDFTTSARRDGRGVRQFFYRQTANLPRFRGLNPARRPTSAGTLPQWPLRFALFFVSPASVAIEAP